MANATVVLAVGARPRGQASSLTRTLSTTFTRFGERRLRIAGHDDQLEAVMFEMGQQLENLLGLAAIGNRDNHIALHHHAEIAVHTVAGMEKKCRRAGARQGRGDLAADQTGLSRRRSRPPCPAVAQHLDRAHETFIQAVDHGQHALGLDPQHLGGTT